MRNTLTFRIKRLHVLVLGAVTVVATLGATVVALVGDDEASSAGPRISAPNQPPARTQPLATVEERNAARIADLLVLKDALLFYRQEEDNYPSTNGHIQTLCNFQDLDVGCKLQDVLTNVPRDPSGGEFNYLFQSDDESFTVAAQWEGDEEPPAVLSCPFALAPEEGRRICITHLTDTSSLGGAVPEPTARPSSAASQNAPGTPDERNDRRLDDLRAIRQALLQFREAEGVFPSTTSRVQTLCTYVDNDVGCALGDIMDEIPHDPSGGNFGYFYAADENAFVVASIWEGESSPPAEFACPESNLELPNEEKLACVTETE